MMLLLLPGLDGTGELFAPFLAALDDRHPALVVRYRDEQVFEDYVATAAAALPVGKALLVAESFSGPVALALLARYPERIRGAVLCATFAVSPFRPLTRIARFVPTPLFGRLPGHALLLRLFCFDASTHPMLRAQVLAVGRAIPPATLKARLTVLAGLDLRALLPQITRPVLFLRGRHDSLVGKRLARQLVAGLPRVTEREIDGPHLLLQCKPRECLRELLSFLAQLDA